MDEVEEEMQRRGLSRAVRPEEAEDLAFLDGEIELAKREIR